MTDVDVAGKYTLLDSLPMQPGRDWITRSDNNGPFIDTGCDIQFAETGRLYLAVDTIREMALAAGLFDNLEPVDIERDMKRYAEGVQDGMEAHGTFDLAVEQLRAAADRIAGRAGVEAAEPAEDEPAVLVTDGPDASRRRKGAEPKAVGTARPRGEGDGPRRNRRPAGVPAGAGDGDAFRI